MTSETSIKRCKAILKKQYGPRFQGLVLFGSRARADAEPGSDIDLLVLLSSPVDYFAELRRIIDLLYPVQLKSEHLISAKPAAVDEYEKGALQLYRHARREGVMV